MSEATRPIYFDKLLTPKQADVKMGNHSMITAERKNISDLVLSGPYCRKLRGVVSRRCSQIGVTSTSQKRIGKPVRFRTLSRMKKPTMRELELGSVWPADAAVILKTTPSHVLQMIDAGELRPKMPKSGPLVRKYTKVLRADVLAMARRNELQKMLERSEYGTAFGIFTCIYFLMSGERTMYLGRTNNLMYRIGQHQQTGRISFDGIKFLRCGGSDLEKLEGDLIAMLKPPMNRQLVGDDHRHRLWK